MTPIASPSAPGLLKNDDDHAAQHREEPGGEGGLLDRSGFNRQQIDRREILVWGLAAAALSFLVRTYLLHQGAERFAIFDSLGFFAAAALLARSSPCAATRPSIGVALAATGLAAFGPNHAAGVSLTLLSLIVLWARDANARAAGAIMLALAGHQLWSKILFAAVGPEIVGVDATLVGSMTQALVPSATWHGNIISTAPTFSIVVEEGCSSFSNVSLAVLCYVSVSRLERAEWRRGDLWVIGAVCATQIILNVARIFAMAQSYPVFAYWHDGGGAQIYAVVASASAVLISALGTERATRR